MDIRCPKCGGPWGIDALHDAVEEGRFPSFDKARKAFTTSGCGVVFGTHCVPSDDPDVAAVAEILDLLGDDIDGAAALLEDFGLV